MGEEQSSLLLITQRNIMHKLCLNLTAKLTLAWPNCLQYPYFCHILFDHDWTNLCLISSTMEEGAFIPEQRLWIKLMTRSKRRLPPSSLIIWDGRTPTGSASVQALGCGHYAITSTITHVNSFQPLELTRHFCTYIRGCAPTHPHNLRFSFEALLRCL